jgi:hypothetical protein
MASYRLWKLTLDGLRETVEALRPDRIVAVGPWLLEDMAAYSRSPSFYRRRRAECLCSALVFKLIAVETGRDHSRQIKHHLGRAVEWRRQEKPAPVVVRKIAA